MGSATRYQRIILLKAMVTGLAVVGIVWLGSGARRAMLNTKLYTEIASGDSRSALQTAAKLAWYVPRDMNLAIARADLLLKANEQSEAARILKEISGRVGDSISENIRLGLKMQEMGLFDCALRHLQVGLGRDPQNIDAQRAVVTILGIQRREIEQERALWAWYSSGNSSVEALRLLAQGEVVIPPGSIPNTSDEGQILEKQISLEPDSVSGTAALAYFYRNRGEKKKADGILQAAMSNNPDGISLVTEKLAALIDSGDGEVAGQLLLAMAPQVDDSAMLTLLKADYLRSIGNYEKAIQEYRKSLKLGGRNPKIYFRMAECCRLAGMDKEKEYYLKKYQVSRQLTYDAAAIEFRNPDTRLMLKLATTCLEIDRMEEAKAWAREVLKREKENEMARKIMEIQAIQ